MGVLNLVYCWLLSIKCHPSTPENDDGTFQTKNGTSPSQKFSILKWEYFTCIFNMDLSNNDFGRVHCQCQGYPEENVTVSNQQNRTWKNYTYKKPFLIGLAPYFVAKPFNTTTSTQRFKHFLFSPTKLNNKKAAWHCNSCYNNFIKSKKF